MAGFWSVRFNGGGAASRPVLGRARSLDSGNIDSRRLQIQRGTGRYIGRASTIANLPFFAYTKDGRRGRPGSETAPARSPLAHGLLVAVPRYRRRGAARGRDGRGDMALPAEMPAIRWWYCAPIPT